MSRSFSNLTAFTTREVLRDEADAIHGAGAVRPDLEGKEFYVALNRLKSAALCLSGGGIRSAAFSLGVIQALAVNPRRADGERVGAKKDALLSQFHYLSTVSGGGYAGGWLSAWLTREYRSQRQWGAMWESMAGERATPEGECRQIAWLRAYSNYLTPRLGIMSADAWTTVALSLRNLILNWLVILPVLCVSLIVLKLVASAIAWVPQFDPRTCSVQWGSARLLFIVVGVAGLVSLLIALRFTTRNRPSMSASTASQRDFLRWGLAPTCIAAVMFTVAIATPCAETFARDGLRSGAALAVKGLGMLAAAGALSFGVAWLTALPQGGAFAHRVRDLAAWTVSGAVYGTILALGVFGYFFGIPDDGAWLLKPKEILLIVFGLPFALSAQLVAEMIFVGLTSYQSGSDADREWLARGAGWYLVLALVWAVTMLGVFIGSSL